MLAQLRGLEGVEPEDIELRGLVPDASIREYSDLIGYAVRYTWNRNGHQLQDGRSLDDF